MDGTSMDAVLYCIQEFNEITDELNFDTGDDLFNNFRWVLCGAAKDDWDLVITIIQNCTPTPFLRALKQWNKMEMILPTAHKPARGNPQFSG